MSEENPFNPEKLVEQDGPNKGAIEKRLAAIGGDAAIETSKYIERFQKPEYEGHILHDITKEQLDRAIDEGSFKAMMNEVYQRALVKAKDQGLPEKEANIIAEKARGDFIAEQKRKSEERRADWIKDNG